MKKSLFVAAVISGILIRLLLSIFTYHRDIAAYTTSAKLMLVENHWLDLYDAVLRPDPQGKDYLLQFSYQPLAYLIPTAFYAPFTPLVASVADGLRHTGPYALVGKTFFLPLFIFKLPFLTADLLILFLLPKLFDKNKRRLVMAMWALNPVAIFVSSMIAQIDMVLLLFVIIALLFHKQKKFFYSAVFLGLSALTKQTALLMLPILAISSFRSKKSFIQSVLVMITGLVVYAAGILPYFRSPGYRATALFADLISKTTFAGIAISPGYAIPWFFIGLTLTIYLYLTRRIPTMAAFGGVIFSSLAFTHFHPQWFVWITPWLIWLAVDLKQNLIALLTLCAWAVVWISFGTTLHLEMFFGLPNNVVHLPIFLIAQANELVLLSRAWLVAFFALLLTYPYEQVD